MDPLSRRLPVQVTPAAVLAAGVAMRLAIFGFTGIPGLLAKRPELAPPTTSFRSRESRFWVRMVTSLKPD